VDVENTQSRSVRYTSLKVRVLYADTDKMGVVYYGTYLRWFEAGRNHYMRCRGVSYKDIESSGVQLPVIEAHAEYRKPALYDDVLEIITRVTEVGRIQLRFEYLIKRGGTQLVHGYTQHAAVNEKGRPTRLPAHVREALEQSEVADIEESY
jgi:acyl-CoA thioester hydrolase